MFTPLPLAVVSRSALELTKEPLVLSRQDALLHHKVQQRPPLQGKYLSLSAPNPPLTTSPDFLREGSVGDEQAEHEEAYARVPQLRDGRAHFLAQRESPLPGLRRDAQPAQRLLLEERVQ